MNLSMKQKQTHRHREQQTRGCQGRGWQGRDAQGAGHQQMQIITYRMDKQQGPPIQYRELYTTYCDKS